MNRVWLGILLLLGSLVSASAQQLLPIVVSSCGTPPTTYTAGRSYQPTMDTTGTLCTVSGGGSSVTVTQGTAASSGPWIMTPWIAGAVNSATNGTYGNLLQGNAVLSATNGIYANLLQGNAVLSSSNPIFATVTGWGGGTLGAMANYGTSPGAVLVPGVNAFITNGLTGFGQNGAFSGNNIGIAGAVYNSGGVSVGNGNATALQSDAAGNLDTDCKIGCAGAITNPTSTLALPSTTTAYTAGQLVCTSATVGTCNTALASQSFAIVNSAGGVIIPRVRLTTSDSTSTAWGAQTLTVDLWSAAPTFATTGDRGSFATDFSTGSAGHFGAYTCVMSAELGDGAYSECFPTVGTAEFPKLASGTAIYWTLTATTGSGITGASKVFTLTPEVLN